MPELSTSFRENMLQTSADEVLVADVDSIILHIEFESQACLTIECARLRTRRVLVRNKRSFMDMIHH